MASAFESLAQRALDSAFATFGAAATYSPPSGPSVSCTIIVNAADDVAQLGQSGFVSARREVEARLTEASPVKGGTFTLGAQTLKIVAAPRRDDPERLVWTCLCDPD